MDITLEFTGSSCDLALHPVSPRTAQVIRSHGRKIYAEKYMNWWRRGTTRNFGMRLDADTTVRLLVDGVAQNFDSSALLDRASALNPELFLDSRARYIAVMGFTDERCTYRWTWNDVTDFNPAHLACRVLDLAPCLMGEGFKALSDATYQGRPASDFNWGNPGGFTLIDPVIVDLNRVRKAVAVA